MKVISNEVIDRTWAEINNLAPQELVKLVEKLGREQPAILAYLMAAGMNDLSQEEHELLVFYGLSLWQMVNEAGFALQEISLDDLMQAEENNMKMLEYLSQESESDLIKTVETIWKGYNQKGLLMYIIEALIEESEPEEEALIEDDESRAYIFICLKTLIDCLDRAGEEAPD